MSHVKFILLNIDNTISAISRIVTQSVSSDSNSDLGSSLASTINGLPKLPRETDLTASCQQLRYSGCVGVLDMFGSEKRKVRLCLAV